MIFGYQTVQTDVTGPSDTDWAGCKRTAKSTSGGMLLVGRHMVRCWSATQKTIALSSAEAELIALVKASCEAIGMMHMCKEWGIDLEGQILADSSAAIGVVNRKGNCKLRHVRNRQLWVQEKREKEELVFSKVKGTENPPI